MNWLKRKPDYSVCQECGAVYVPTGDPQFAYLCAVHRKEPEERARRKRFVIEWAMARWEKLEEQAKKETTDCRVDLYAKQQASMSGLGGQTGLQQTGLIGGLYGLHK